MLKLNKEDLKKLENLFYIREANIYFNDVINEVLLEENEEEPINGLNLTIFNDENGNEDKDTFNEYKKFKLDKSYKLNIDEYMNDSYFKNVKLKEIKDKNYHLYNKLNKKNKLFIFKELEVDEEYREINFLGYSDKDFYPLTIDKDDVTWMSVIPNEINTMKKDIEDAKGNVLIYGLGLGYFLYHVSNKKEVNKVVVAEKDKKIIEIFNKYLIEFFNMDKIEIIDSDAIYFNKKINSNEFNYVFSDLWHDPIDGLELYYKLLKEEKENIKYRYWIEKSILAYFRRIVISLFIEEREGYTDKDYLNNPKDFETKLINSLHFYLKPIEFNSYIQIYDLLKDESLKNLLKKLTIK